MQAAERHLAAALPAGCSVPLRGSGRGWRAAGRGRRSAARSIRFWTKSRLLRAPVPLTGPRALSAEAPQGHADWMVAFLEAVASEAADYMEMLRSLEHGWRMARGKVAEPRSTSRAALAVDVLAAAPLISATTLARAIGMSIKCATELLDRFVATEVAVEVTHRSARRLFGLKGLAPLRDAVRPPYRPDPARGPGRPRAEVEDELPAAEFGPLPPLTPIERRAFDYTALEEAMAHLDAVVRQVRCNLGVSNA